MNPILAASLALALFLEPQDRSQRPQPQQNAASDKRGTPQATLVVQVASANPSQSQARGDTDEKADRTRNESLTAWSTFALAIITFLLAVGTAFLARYTLKLWQETKRLAEDAKSNAEIQAQKMEASVHEAVRAANAMEDQVRKTDEIAQQELRAYIGPSALTIDAELDVADVRRRAISVAVKNYGSTPANDVQLVVLRSIALADGSDLPGFDGQFEGSDPSTYMLYPNGEPLKVPAAAWNYPAKWDQDIASGQRAIFVQCQIRYRDIFRKRNIVTCRWRIMETPPHFQVCETGNYASYGEDVPEKT